MKEKIYNYEDRLVDFASKSIIFCRTLPKNNIGKYYFDQILRSSGSSALHYGEAQGSETTKDFIYKISILVKELKETRIALKILTKVGVGNAEARKKLLLEIEELIAIASKMILNKKRKRF